MGDVTASGGRALNFETQFFVKKYSNLATNLKTVNIALDENGLCHHSSRSVRCPCDCGEAVFLRRLLQYFKGNL